MTFRSLLFEHLEDALKDEPVDAPDFFADLNLDQVVDAITAGREEYDLKPFFYRSLSGIEAVKYRHEIMQDLENTTLFGHVSSFAQKLRLMRANLIQANKFYYEYQKQAWFLDTLDIYCDATTCFAKQLSTAALKSRGLCAFRKYLTGYGRSSNFLSLVSETKTLKAELAKVRYCVLIDGPRVTVRKCDSEPNYSADVENTFERFKQGAVKDYKVSFSELPEMNHIEAQILEFVAQLYPELFVRIASHCSGHRIYLDELVAVFDREVQFYVACLEYLTAFKAAGLKFCYPEVSGERKDICDYEGFDLALARRLIAENASVVCNDFQLKGRERILAVSGPNQGGKTTFARTFGQLHYLASIGCPVPGREARLLLFDNLFTHFEREEDITNFRGKLQDDLVRIHRILGRATSKSILITNEMFTSTTLTDGIFLSKKVMEKIVDLGLLCVWVTFIDEVTSYGEQVVSMVSSVDPENLTSRTFKIIRRPADGLAYAIAIAEKHGLTYNRLTERLKS